MERATSIVPRAFLLANLSAGEPEKQIFYTMNTNEFMQQAVPLFKEQLTDIFFTFVQNNRELMKAYLDTVATTGNLQVTNSHIAQQLTQEFSLTNSGETCDMPISHLIQSYSKLK